MRLVLKWPEGPDQPRRSTSQHDMPKLKQVSSNLALAGWGGGWWWVRGWQWWWWGGGQYTTSIMLYCTLQCTTSIRIYVAPDLNQPNLTQWHWLKLPLHCCYKNTYSWVPHYIYCAAYLSSAVQCCDALYYAELQLFMYYLCFQTCPQIRMVGEFMSLKSRFLCLWKAKDSIYPGFFNFPSASGTCLGAPGCARLRF